MALMKNRCTAKKTSRYGVTYRRHGDGAMRCTLWRFGTIWCVRFASVQTNPQFSKIWQENYTNRAAAMFAVGEWIDPEQDGKAIIDNDSANLRTMSLELRNCTDIKYAAWEEAA